MSATGTLGWNMLCPWCKEPLRYTVERGWLHPTADGSLVYICPAYKITDEGVQQDKGRVR